MLGELFSQLNFWHWMIAGVILLIFELLVPTTFLMWPGIAALLLSALTWLFPDITIPVQVIIFAVLSVLSTVVHRAYVKRHPQTSDHPVLNQRGQQYLGRVFTLESAIVNGIGRIKVGDSSWQVEGPDLAVGQRVKVIGVASASLQVEHVAG